MAKHPLPCTFSASSKMSKTSALNFVLCACADESEHDEFLATVTEGLVYCVYKVVSWSSFGVTWCVEVNGHFTSVSELLIRTSQLKDAFHLTPTTAGYTDCSVNETPNLVRYEADLPWSKKTLSLRDTACSVTGALM